MNTSEYRKYKEAFRTKLKTGIEDDKVIAEVQESIRPTIGKIPNSFFRYRQLNMFTLSEILNGTVYLAELKDFDDVLDSKCFVSDIGEAEGPAGAYSFFKSIEAHLPERDKNIRYYEESLDKINKMIEKKLGIACFTQKNDNIPMWFYYADEHKGICIEYDFTNLEDFRKLQYLFMPVIYSKPDQINGYKLFENEENNENVIAIRNALVKSKDWSFEKEWRMIKFFYKEKGNDDNNDKKKDRLVPVKIKRIYFGYKTPEEAKIVVSNIIEKNNLNIELYNMEITEMGLKPKKYGK